MNMNNYDNLIKYGIIFVILSIIIIIGIKIYDKVKCSWYLKRKYKNCQFGNYVNNNITQNDSDVKFSVLINNVSISNVVIYKNNIKYYNGSRYIQQAIIKNYLIYQYYLEKPLNTEYNIIYNQSNFGDLPDYLKVMIVQLFKTDIIDIYINKNRIVIKRLIEAHPKFSNMKKYITDIEKYREISNKIKNTQL